MVVIRLMRGGSKKRPKYRITVADSRRWQGGRFLEVIGNFNPAPRGAEQKLTLDIAKANEWIAKGAQPTLRVKSLLKMASAPGAATAPPKSGAKGGSAKPPEAKTPETESVITSVVHTVATAVAHSVEKLLGD